MSHPNHAWRGVLWQHHYRCIEQEKGKKQEVHDWERRLIYLKWGQNRGVEAGRLRESRWNQHMGAVVRQYIGFLKMAAFEWD